MPRDFMSPIPYSVHRRAGFVPDLGRWIDRVQIAGDHPEAEVAEVLDERDLPLALLFSHAGGAADERLIREIVITEYCDGVRPVVTIGWPDGDDEIVQAVDVEIETSAASAAGRGRVHGTVTVEATVDRTKMVTTPPDIALKGLVVTDRRLTAERRDHFASVIAWAAQGENEVT